MCSSTFMRCCLLITGCAKTFLTFEFLDQILRCDLTDRAVLPCGVVCHAVQNGSNFKRGVEVIS